MILYLKSFEECLFLLNMTDKLLLVIMRKIRYSSLLNDEIEAYIKDYKTSDKEKENVFIEELKKSKECFDE